MSGVNKKTILLIDDDHDIVEATSMRLRTAGFNTITASEAEQGLETATHNRPDAIVLDVRMPGMGGLKALAELKKRTDTQQIPVVMLSASVIDQNRCLDAGAGFFIRKPYVSQDVVIAIENAIADI